MKTVIDLVEAVINSKDLMNPTKEVGALSSMFKRLKASPDQAGKAVSAIEKSIEKGRYTLDQAFALLEHMEALGTRVIFSFDTEQEVENFKADNNCGNDWFKDGKYHVYKYTA